MISGRGSSTREERDEDEGDRREQLDENMYRGAGRVLARVSHRVTRHRGLMSFAVLPPELSCFDVLLGVIPGSTSVVKEESHEDARARRKHQEAGESLGSQELASAERPNNSKEDANRDGRQHGE